METAVYGHFETRAKYLDFLQTLALTTDTYLTIDENASVNGSVYGVSESGFVQRNTDVKIQSGTIGSTKTGNVFGGGKGVHGFDKAGRVRGNTKVAVNGGDISGNVYGGGELGFVGKFIYTSDGKTYIWQKITSRTAPPDSITTGSCSVIVTGGKIGPDNNLDKTKGNVFGAGKGEALTFKCEPALVRTSSVIVSNGTVNGNVYGGGEVGRVDLYTSVAIGFNHLANANTTYYQKMDNTYSEASVTPGSSNVVGYYIRSGEEGLYTYTPIQAADAPIINGCVFGAGAGVNTHGYSALVRGNTTVTVEGNAGIYRAIMRAMPRSARMSMAAVRLPQ